MTVTGLEAVARARTYRRYPPGLCLQFVRICLDVNPKYDDAETAWTEAQWKHPGGFLPPVGVPCWWQNDSIRGHVALSDGTGAVYSTDYPGRGQVARVGIARLTSEWNMHYRGWTEDINGVRVFGAGAAAIWETTKKILAGVISGGRGASVGAGIPNPIDSLAGAFGFVSDLSGFVTDTRNWFRLALFLGGVALIVLAALQLVGTI